MEGSLRFGEAGASAVLRQAAGTGARVAAAGLFAFCVAQFLILVFDPLLSDRPTLVALNALPVALVLFALWLCTARLLLAATLTFGLLWALFTANRLKLMHLERALVPGDFVMLPQVLESTDLYGKYVSIDGAAVLGFLVIAGLLAWREPRLFAIAGRSRGAWLLATVLAGALLLDGRGAWSAVYAADRLPYLPWAPTESVQRSGLVANLVRATWNLQLRPPAADRTLLAEFDRFATSRLEPAAIAGPRTEVPPDLVIWQSESWFDPTRVRGLEHAIDRPAFQRLRARGLSGTLAVPAYGGGTTRTEFEVLTGSPMAAWPTVEYPYSGLLHGPARGLPRALARHGYRSTALHPYLGRFYRRDRVLPWLGFDAFHDETWFLGADGRGELRFEREGYFVADRTLVEGVMAALGDGSGEPRFVFAISIENHGPWEPARPVPPEATARIRLPEGLAQEEDLALRQYLHHLETADHALGALWQRLQQRGRRTLLVFYGDHLPGLHTIFERMGFVDGRHAVEQPTEYLVLDTAQDLGGVQLPLGAYELGALALTLAGRNDDAHFRRVRAAQLSRALQRPEYDDARLADVARHSSWFHGMDAEPTPAAAGAAP